MARVLVIDDDPGLRRAVQVSLAARGHEVAVAATGEDGLSSVALHEPEVVLLDLGLPDVDGLVVCRRIRQWTQVPVIVLSATGLEERKVAALDGGADDYVTKPFGMAELEARVRAALRHRGPPPAADRTRVGVADLDVDLVHHQARRGG